MLGRCSLLGVSLDCIGLQNKRILKRHQRHEQRNSNSVYTQLARITGTSDQECRQKTGTADHRLVGQR